MTKHGPVYESASKVFHACIDLLDISYSMYPEGAQNLVKKYIPILYCTFGNEDEDVKKIERVIVSSYDQYCKNKQCENCKKQCKKLFTCNRCKLIRYCGRSCQVQHWKTIHKEECIEC